MSADLKAAVKLLVASTVILMVIPIASELFIIWSRFVASWFQ